MIHKFYKRLTHFLKLKKYAQNNLRGDPARRIFSRTFKYNGLKRQYLLSKDLVHLGHLWDGEVEKKINITKKKGGILSYLFTVICRFPKKYVYWFLSKEIYKKYYTMPFRLSLSRFISFLTFKGYYGSGCARIWKKASKGPDRRNVKKVLSLTEKRLDSTVLRLLHFKSPFTTKIRTARIHKVKSPWSTFASPYLTAKQLINHGHIYINEKPTHLAGVQLKTSDMLRLRRRADRGGSPIGDSLIVKEFSKLYYIVYRNMYYVDRNLVSTNGNPCCNNVEKDIMRIFYTIVSVAPLPTLPIFSLFRLSKFSTTKIMQSKPGILTDRAGSNILARSKEDKWSSQLQRQRLLRWKRLQNTTKDIPSQMSAIVKQDPSLMYSRFTRCYASIVYGTRRCEWVQLQQRGNQRARFFCRTLAHKTNFLEAELEYFQLVLKHYF